jgi:D-3-phosphoglycerate dehydrogenase
MPKIFISSDFVMDAALDETARVLLKQGHEVVRGPRAVPGVKTTFREDDFPRYFSDADVLVLTTRMIITPALLDSAKRLRGIVFPSIGTESINLAEASRRGLLVANGATPENFLSMSEATVMLILNLFYGLHKTERLLRESLPRPKVMHARMLRGKTIGLIGLGRIARGVAERLQGWGVRLLGVDPHITSIPGVSVVDLDTLLAESDLVSVHTVLNETTHHLIDARSLKLMKRGAFLVNVSRGLCVDELAVAEALRGGQLAGAALDAFEVEPLPEASPLRDADAAILTPHMVGHTVELFESFAPACIANIEAMLRGELPHYVCNPQVADEWIRRFAS